MENNLGSEIVKDCLEVGTRNHLKNNTNVVSKLHFETYILWWIQLQVIIFIVINNRFFRG